MRRWWARRRGREPIPWRTLDLEDPRRANARMFAVSLLDDPTCEPRRAMFTRHARRHGWDVDFWPAVDGGRLDGFPDWVSADERPSHPEPIRPGELGLIVTIRTLYDWALEEGLDHLVVLEDDALVHAPPVLEVPEEYDFVFFNDLLRGDAEGRLRYGWGSYAHVVSRRGLEKMRAILERVVEPLDLQILMYCRSLAELDHYITAYRDPDLPQLDCFHVGPLATHAGMFESSIRSRWG